VSFRNAFGIYHVLERLLKASQKPLTSVELFDSPDVRQYADDINKVSDYLGHMFRRDLLSRVPSRGYGMAKWAYFWKNPKVGTRVPAQRHAAPRLVVKNLEEPSSTPSLKTPLRVVENADGSLAVELPSFIITITSVR
jgi:hypothetical protein